MPGISPMSILGYLYLEMITHNKIEWRLSSIFLQTILPPMSQNVTLWKTYSKKLNTWTSLSHNLQVPNTLAAAAAAAKSLQLCPTLCDPIDGSPPGSPSLGFSRQEHWSGLPFPSPMHESEKWKWSRSVVSDSSDPMDCSLPGSSVHGIF